MIPTDWAGFGIFFISSLDKGFAAWYSKKRKQQIGGIAVL